MQEKNVATGLIALLDDVAAIAKLAASSLDDVAAQTAEICFSASLRLHSSSKTGTSYPHLRFR